MQKYLPKGIFKKYLENTVVYHVSSEYCLKYLEQYCFTVKVMQDLTGFD